MKKVVLLLLITVLSLSCSKVKDSGDFKVVVIDGCQYLKAEAYTGGYMGYGYFAHKGNCSNPIHCTN